MIIYSCHGASEMMRTRYNVFDSNIRCDVRCIGADKETKTVVCQYGTPSAWSACDPQTGLQTRTTYLTTRFTCGVGCLPETKESRSCAVNCEWEPWGEWGGCKKVGPDWVRERLRVKVVTEKNGGTCGGEATDSGSGKCKGITTIQK